MTDFRQCTAFLVGLLVLTIAGTPTTATADDSQHTGLWAGFFMGADFGGDDRVGLMPTGPYVGRLAQVGPVGGLRMSYRWTDSGLVFGLTGDLGAAHVTDSIATADYRAHSTQKTSGSLLALVGWPTEDGMYYVTAGLSVAEFDYRVQGPDVGIDTTFSTRGPSIGLGFERHIAQNWVWQVQALHTTYDPVWLNDATYHTKATPKHSELSVAMMQRF